jgi:hypothetical protein
MLNKFFLTAAAFCIFSSFFTAANNLSRVAWTLLSIFCAILSYLETIQTLLRQQRTQIAELKESLEKISPTLTDEQKANVRFHLNKDFPAP